MDFVAKDTTREGGFTPVPPGTHLARCYRVIDLGTQRTEWQGQIKLLEKVMILFEVHGEDESGRALLTRSGEPLSISKNYTRSLGQKTTLRKDLSAWRGRDFSHEELRGFALKQILGAWAMISVAPSIGNDGREYSNIVSVNAVPASIKKSGLPDGYNKTSIFHIPNADMDLFETFSRNLQEKIMASPEWQQRKGSGINHQPPVPAAPVPALAVLDDMDDDIPF
jgi:hypothetical protein